MPTDPTAGPTCSELGLPRAVGGKPIDPAKLTGAAQKIGRALRLEPTYRACVDALRDMLDRFAPSDDGLSDAEIACAERARKTIADHAAACDHTDTHMIDGGRACAACGATWTGGCAPAAGED